MPSKRKPKSRPHLLAGENLPHSPSQARSLDKRERLKAAALDLFGSRGYEGTSVTEIARQSGLAVGTVYQHYRSKRQLLLALMDDLLAQLAELQLTVESGSDVRTSLRAFLARAFAIDLRYLAAYRAWQEAVLTDPTVLPLDRELHEWTAGRVERLFEELGRRPGARTDVDVTALARSMDLLFWSLAARAALDAPAELERNLDSAVHVIYHSLFHDEKERRSP